MSGNVVSQWIHVRVFFIKKTLHHGDDAYRTNSFVDETGFEPATLGTQNRRSPS